MDFGEAVESLKNGNNVQRRSWYSREYLKLHLPDGSSGLTVPVICKTTMTNEVIPWSAAHSDILADDWETCQ